MSDDHGCGNGGGGEGDKTAVDAAAVVADALPAEVAAVPAVLATVGSAVVAADADAVIAYVASRCPLLCLVYAHAIIIDLLVTVHTLNIYRPLVASRKCCQCCSCILNPLRNLAVGP